MFLNSLLLVYSNCFVCVFKMKSRQPRFLLIIHPCSKTHRQTYSVKNIIKAGVYSKPRQVLVIDVIFSKDL